MLTAVAASWPTTAASPLYGIDYLMADKVRQFNELQADLEAGKDLEATIRLREEISEQHRALGQMKEMAARYGYDISGPATNAHEAVQWTYFGYLAAVKSQNGAAMSFGRVSTFLDIYIERDLKNGVITESQAQEMIDHLVMKLRMVRFLRTPEYDQLFSGDPIWATESIGAWVWTAERSSPKTASASSTPCTTWGRHPSRT